MPDPLVTLIELTDKLLDLDMIQDWIDNARIFTPDNKRVQLELDSRQDEVNRKRELIKMIMLDISSRN